MAPKIKPIRRDSNDVSAMLIPCRLELLMKPSASSVIKDTLISEDRFIAENCLQGNTIIKSTFIHHLHNSILNSRTDTSKCNVHEMHFIQNPTGNFWPQGCSTHFWNNCWKVPTPILFLPFVENYLFPTLQSFGFLNFWRSYFETQSNYLEKNMSICAFTLVPSDNSHWFEALCLATNQWPTWGLSREVNLTE